MNPQPFIERDLVVREGSDLSVGALTRLLHCGQTCEEGFLRVAAPLPPRFGTRLLVQRKAGELQIAALLSTEASGAGSDPWQTGAVELFFDLRHDGIGFIQFAFREGAPPAVNDFSPYPEARSTRWKLPRIKRWGFAPVEPRNPTPFGTPRRIFHAVFHEKEIFASGTTVGFNFCRHDGATGEYSSWSFLAGCGAPDATSLGRLHQRPPAAAPCPPPKVPPAASFRLSVTNDIPMMLAGGPYTPDTLHREMRTLKAWGVGRLHWIDYSRFPAFWSRPLWGVNHRKAERACGGDLLAAACRAAKRNQIELVADFKLFDLGFATAWASPARFPAKEGLLPFVKGQPVRGLPEKVGNEDAIMQTHPAGRRETAFPIRTLRLYSCEPLPEIRPAHVRLFGSSDNVHYAPLSRRGLRIAVREIRRDNLRWTPAGPFRERGTHRAWVLEITGLALAEPYLGVEIGGSVGAFVNPHFALVEAEDAAGSRAPFICTPGGGGEYPFFRKWPGWNNANEPATSRTTLPFSGFGIAFLEPPVLTGMLEPLHPTARQIWLGRIGELLEHDLSGVSLRTLCHHRRCQSWLQYAYAPAVVAAFERRHGRPPGVGVEDEAKVRTLRGEAMGELLAEAKAMAGRKRKKLIFQVEAGSELPPTHESRMAIWYDYEKWIAARLFDELHVRAITGHSRWLRSRLLPLAKRQGVEVHLITRNQDRGLDARDQLDLRRIIADARQNGYHGLNLYESANLYEIGQGGNLLPRAMATACMEAATQEATRTA